jgi:transposase
MGEQLMANELAMDKKQGIEQLFASGMSERQIARTLEIDRKSVSRHLRKCGAKGASPTKAPTGTTGQVPKGSKGAKAPTGSDSLQGHGAEQPITEEKQCGDSALIGPKPNEHSPQEEEAPPPKSRSRCAAYHDLILAKLESGLDAQRIYQDLVRDHGFQDKYHSVRRYVHWLGQSKELPVRRIEVEPGQELQVDYGIGARCLDHSGKLRRTYLFRCVLSHSSKGYTETPSRR